MAGFFETFVRYVEAFDSDPFTDAADRVRSDRGRGSAAERDELAREIERAGRVWFGKDDRR